jgi:hypothetical protein
MDEQQSLNHSKWECKYHVVFIPKCRRKTLYAQLRRHLGEVFRRLAEQKESKIEEGHLMPDHVHMMISIPPKYAVSQVIGFVAAADGGEPDREPMQGQIPSPWMAAMFATSISTRSEATGLRPPRLRHLPRRAGCAAPSDSAAARRAASSPSS